MAARMSPATPLTSAAAIVLLDRGERPFERDLLRLLRSPSCPQALVERLATCRWVLRERRALPLVIRHPACPRGFSMDGLARLGWRDLVDVARYPRAAPLVRRQAERKLLDRIPQMALGERIALARIATRAVMAGLLASGEVRCVQALLDNSQFTEDDAVRLLQVNRATESVLAVVRHPRWGAGRLVLRAAIRHPLLPLGIALGLVAGLPASDLADLAESPDLAPALRASAGRLLRHRGAEDGSR